MIICGSGSLPREEQEEDYLNNLHEGSTQSAGSSPRKSCSLSKRIRTPKKNPYSTRGLDKFVALLAEIEEKKQKIYSNNSPEEISFVQFDYSNGNNCKPVVIKVKQKKKNIDLKQSPVLDPVAVKDDHNDKIEAPNHVPVRKLKLQKLRKPSYYLSAILILILILLVLFGRSVAILCTSITWYAIPAISNRRLRSTRSFKKREELRTNSGKA